MGLKHMSGKYLKFVIYLIVIVLALGVLVAYNVARRQ